MTDNDDSAVRDITAITKGLTDPCGSATFNIT